MLSRLPSVTQKGEGAGFHTEVYPLTLLANLLGKTIVLKDGCPEHVWLPTICSGGWKKERVSSGRSPDTQLDREHRVTPSASAFSLSVGPLISV